jgi:hypothetical protein
MQSDDVAHAAALRFRPAPSPEVAGLQEVPWFVLRSALPPPTVTQVVPEQPTAVSGSGPFAACIVDQLEDTPTCL